MNIKVKVESNVSNLEIIHTQTNPNILLTHYFQYKRKKWHKFEEKRTYLKCKPFCQTLQPLAFCLQQNSNLQDNVKVYIIPITKGENNMMSTSK